MIHGFYLGKLQNILNTLPPGGHKNGLPGLDLYVSTPLSQIEEAKKILANQKWPRVLLCDVSSRGRDIAPCLLNLLPKALRAGHHAFVKLHTKKLPQFKGGIDWSDHLINNLLHNKFLSQLSDNLEKDPQLGLFAPAGTLLNGSVTLGYNVDHIQLLPEKKYWDGAWALSQYCVAASMIEE